MDRKFWNYLVFSLLILVSWLPGDLKAQAVDYTKLKVEELSNEQILQMMTRAEEQGLSQSGMFEELIAQGMPAGEVSKLRVRVNRLRKAEIGDQNLSVLVDPTEEGRSVGNTSGLVETSVGEMQSDGKPQIYGASLFRNGNIRFEPNLNMPTPMNYIVGSGDQLNIDVTGDNEVSYKLAVSP